ncbi:MAG TPA: DUF559 domain-containing protein [Rhodanobacteraceae bacterium]|nr:DUF559 domain-containing protein [Rhodanobacteraceae bacterium]
MKRDNVALARALRRRMTDAERVLWRQLRGRHFEHWKFRRQHQVSNYIVDFICLAAGLIIELDGGQHLQNVTADAERTRELNQLGFRVIRFWNDDVLIRTGAVLEQILKVLKEIPPHPSPLPGGEREKRAAAARGLE